MNDLMHAPLGREDAAAGQQPRERRWQRPRQGRDHERSLQRRRQYKSSASRVLHRRPPLDGPHAALPVSAGLCRPRGVGQVAREDQRDRDEQVVAGNVQYAGAVQIQGNIIVITVYSNLNSSLE